MYLSNYNYLSKIIIGFRTGFSSLCLNIFKNKIYKINFTKTWNLYIEIKIKYLYTLLVFLKKHSLLLFSFLMDFVCYEIVGCKYKYTLIYTLLSTHINIRLNLKTRVLFSNQSKILSVVTLFLSSCWAEREIFDFYGLYFFFNKDLRRLLLDYGFKGYPLHKDFPLTGFIELYYDDSIKKITYEKIELNLEYRMLLNR